MSYQVLARKWRPRSFKELTGQEHVSRTLENAIKSGRIAHAYLFSGVRGVGKTTVARILAKSLNCAEGPTHDPCMKCQSCTEISSGFSVDVIEIDGASHTGVDNVRELQESAQYAPLKGRYKIYIIDEVHMLSTSAFNALLKILEEPPPHVVFIFATTEQHKIPGTINSRCQNFQFRRISYREIMDRLRFILQEEGIKASEDALSVVAGASDGSMRDALSLLDQVIAYTGGKLDEGDVTWVLGLADHMTGPFIQHILNRDSANALTVLKEIVDGGYDLKQFCTNVVEYIRNLTITKLGLGQEVIDLPQERITGMAKMVENTPMDILQRIFGIFSKTLEEIRWFPHPRFSFEMAIIKAADMRPVLPVDNLIGRLAEIAKRLSGGITSVEEKKEWIKETKREEDHGNEIIHIPSITSTEVDGKKNTIETKGSDASDIATLWHKVVTRINEEKPSLGSYIEQGVLVGFEDGILSIGFNGGASVFINLIERKDSKDFILERVKAYIPGITAIKFTTISDKKGHSPAYNEYLADQHDKQQSEIEEAFSDQIVKDAIDILGGEVVELRNRKGE